MDNLEYLRDVLDTVPFEEHERLHNMILGAVSNHISHEEWKRIVNSMANFVKGLEK